MAIAARMPTIATAIINSTSVKPLLLKGSDTINIFQLGRLVQNIPRDQKASEGGGKP